MNIVCPRCTARVPVPAGPEGEAPLLCPACGAKVARPAEIVRRSGAVPEPLSDPGSSRRVAVAAAAGRPDGKVLRPLELDRDLPVPKRSSEESVAAADASGPMPLQRSKPNKSQPNQVAAVVLTSEG